MSSRNTPTTEERKSSIEIIRAASEEIRALGRSYEMATLEAIQQRQADQEVQERLDAEIELDRRCHQLSRGIALTHAGIDILKKCDQVFIEEQIQKGHPVERIKVWLQELQENDLQEVECRLAILKRKAREAAADELKAQGDQQKLVEIFRTVLEEIIIDMVASGVLHAK